MYYMISLTYKLKRIEVDPEKDFHTNTIIKDLSLGQSLARSITLDGNVKIISRGKLY